MTQPNPTQPNDPADHATHDLLLIAAGADRGADDATRAAADRRAAECAECAELSADLRSIASGLRQLPRAIPVPAARDFRISPDQADRLRRWSGLRRVLRTFGAGGSPTLRPLATAFTTLGIAGLLFTVLLPGFGTLGSGGASPAAAPARLGAAASQRTSDKSLVTGLSTGGQAPGATAGPAEIAVPGAATPAPASSVASDASGSAQSQSPGGAPEPAPAPLPAEPALSPWLAVTVLSAAALGLGVVLLGLRFFANRLR